MEGVCMPRIFVIVLPIKLKKNTKEIKTVAANPQLCMLSGERREPTFVGPPLFSSFAFSMVCLSRYNPVPLQPLSFGNSGL